MLVASHFEFCAAFKDHLRDREAAPRSDHGEKRLRVTVIPTRLGIEAGFVARHACTGRQADTQPPPSPAVVDAPPASTFGPTDSVTAP